MNPSQAHIWTWFWLHASFSFLKLRLRFSCKIFLHFASRLIWFLVFLDSLSVSFSSRFALTQVNFPAPAGECSISRTKRFRSWSENWNPSTWRSLKSTNYSQNITNSRIYPLCVSTLWRAALQIYLLISVAVSWRRLPERGKRWAARQPDAQRANRHDRLIKRCLPSCDSSHLSQVLSPGRGPARCGERRRADTWQTTVCTVAVCSARSVSAQEECPGGINFLWKGNRGRICRGVCCC